MTKRDYDLIAAVFKANIDVCHEEGLSAHARAYARLAKQLASELLNTNPRFHMSKFLTACGVVHEVSAKQ